MSSVKGRSFSKVLGLSLVGLLAMASAIALPGCGKQGEGMRCDFTPDCEDGLTCRSVASGYACCPQTGGSGACSEGASTPDSGPETSTTETGTETGSETGTETGADAETDGTSDTGSAGDAETDGGSDTGTTAADASDAG
jgi:hypothetical protein